MGLRRDFFITNSLGLKRISMALVSSRWSSRSPLLEFLGNIVSDFHKLIRIDRKFSELEFEFSHETK